MFNLTPFASLPIDQLSRLLVYLGSLCLGLSLYLCLQMPLQWAASRQKREAKFGWDVDDSRHLTLRKQSSFFAHFQPWIVGLADSMRRVTPWMLDANILPARSKTLRRLADIILSSPDKTQRAMVSGVANGAWTVEEYLSSSWITSAGIGAAVAIAVDRSIVSPTFVATFALTSLIAYRYQIAVLHHKAAVRRRLIRRLLPHSLEAFAMTMSAGGTLPEAIEDFVRDFPGHPLAFEYSRLLRDINRGRTKYESLIALSQRLDVSEFDDVLRTMTISDEHGAPVAKFFRNSASQMRVKQLRQMETAIGRAEAQMPLPTMVIMVACMMIAVAPFIVMAVHSGALEQLK